MVPPASHNSLNPKPYKPLTLTMKMMVVIRKSGYIGGSSGSLGGDYTGVIWGEWRMKWKLLSGFPSSIPTIPGLQGGGVQLRSRLLQAVGFPCLTLSAKVIH